MSRFFLACVMMTGCVEISLPPNQRACGDHYFTPPVGLDEVSSFGFTPNELHAEFQDHRSRWEVGWKEAIPADVLRFEVGEIKEAYEWSRPGGCPLWEPPGLIVTFDATVTADGELVASGETTLKADELGEALPMLGFNFPVTTLGPTYQQRVDNWVPPDQNLGVELRSYWDSLRLHVNRADNPGGASVLQCDWSDGTEHLGCTIAMGAP